MAKGGKKSRSKGGKRDAVKSNPLDDKRFERVKLAPEFRIKGSRRNSMAKKVIGDDRFKGMFTDKQFGNSTSEVDAFGRAVDPKDSNNSALRAFYGAEDGEGKTEEELAEKFSGQGWMEMGESSDEEGAAADVEEEEGEQADLLKVKEDAPIEYGDAERRIAVVNMDWDYVSAADIFMILDSGLAGSKGILEGVKVYSSEFGREKMAAEAMGAPDVFEDEASRAAIKAAEENMAACPISDDDDGFVDIGDGPTGEELAGSDDESHVVSRSHQSKEVDGEHGSGFSMAKLRAYELRKLRYYYAVATFDSVGSANRVYELFDGMEVESTSNSLDMRFVPEDQEFDDQYIRDVCDKAPEEYVAPHFETVAASSTNVKLTWDRDDPNRARMAKEAFNNPDAELDFSNLVGHGDTSDEEDPTGKYDDLKTPGNKKKTKKTKKAKNDDVKARNAYTMALLGGGDTGSDSESDMEVTFEPGLGFEAMKRLDADRGLEEMGDNSDDEIAKLPTRRERHAARVRRSKSNNKEGASLRGLVDSAIAGGEDDAFLQTVEGGFFDGDAAGKSEGSTDAFKDFEKNFDFPMDMDGDINEMMAAGLQAEEEEVMGASSSSGRKRVRVKKTKRSKRSKEADADLDLLAMDESLTTPSKGSTESAENKADSGKGKKARRNKKKSKKAAKDDAEAVSAALVKEGLADPRFAALRTSSAFSLDPTDSSFKKTAATEVIMAVRSQERMKLREEEEVRARARNRAAAAGAPPSSKRLPTEEAVAAATPAPVKNVSALVASLKGKASKKATSLLKTKESATTIRSEADKKEKKEKKEKKDKKDKKKKKKKSKKSSN